MTPLVCVQHCYPSDGCILERQSFSMQTSSLMHRMLQMTCRPAFHVRSMGCVGQHWTCTDGLFFCRGRCHFELIVWPQSIWAVHLMHENGHIAAFGIFVACSRYGYTTSHWVGYGNTRYHPLVVLHVQWCNVFFVHAGGML